MRGMRQPSPSPDPPPGGAPLRVLLVAHLEFLRGRLDRTPFFRYEALARRPGVTLFGPGVAGYRPGMGAHEAIDVACGGVPPDAIVHGVDPKESCVPLLARLPEVEALTALEVWDSWTRPERQADFINHQRFDLAFLAVRHDIPTYRDLCPRTEFAWMPNAVNTALFRDHGLAKEWDVILYGNLDEEIYPLRARLARLLAGASDLRVRHIGHPGYYPAGGADSAGVVAGARLSREINRSRIGIATSSVFRCVMAKYFEIAASRTLVAGDMPEEGREIFGDDFLELDGAMSDRELLDALRAHLADPARLRAKTDAAYRRVHAEHSTDAFAGRLLELLDGLAADRRGAAGPAPAGPPWGTGSAGSPP